MFRLRRASAIRHCLLVAGLSAAAVALAPDAGAQGGAPCPPGTPMPSVSAQDRQAGPGGTLTATHHIDLQADFPDGSGPDVQLSAPPGVHVDRMTIVADSPGAVPVTLSWTAYTSGGDECTASTTTTLQLQPPVPLNFGKLPRALQPSKLPKIHGRYWGGGWHLTALVGRYTDRRPLELRFRGIARSRLPSPSMPFKIVTLPLRALEPGFGKQRYLRGPKWEVTARINYEGTAVFLETEAKTGSLHFHPVANELEVLQAGRLMLRVRQAGACRLAECRWRILKVERGS